MLPARPPSPPHSLLLRLLNLLSRIYIYNREMRIARLIKWSTYNRPVVAPLRHWQTDNDKVSYQSFLLTSRQLMKTAGIPARCAGSPAPPLPLPGSLHPSLPSPPLCHSTHHPLCFARRLVLLLPPLFLFFLFFFPFYKYKIFLSGIDHIQH